MHKIINKFLLVGAKFMPELHLTQTEFIYSAYGSFTKHHKRIQKIQRETGNLKLLNRNELDNGCFAHDLAYFDSKDLAKRTILDKILKDKADEIARNCGYDGYQRPLVTFLIRKQDRN